MNMSQNQYQYLKDLGNLGLGEYKELTIEGKDCIIYRHPVNGTLNGYLKVDEKISMDEAEEQFSVHGGISLAGDLTFISPEIKGYWIGFDCNHGLDWSLQSYFIKEEYRNYDYVISELEKLVKQYKQYKSEK